MTASGASDPRADHSGHRVVPRIVLIEGALHENGGLRVTHDLARRWTAAGVPVTLLVLETVAPVRPLLTPDPSIHLVRASARVRRFRWALPLVVLELWRQARRAEVVVAGSEVGYGVILGLPIARLTRRPFVVLVQSTLQQAVADWRPAALRRLLLWMHRHVDLAVCVSPGLAPLVVANGLPADKVRVVEVGIDVDDVIARGARPAGTELASETPDRPPATPVVMAVGRMVTSKGFDLLIRAHARARSLGHDHVLRIIGDGPLRDELTRLALDLGVADSVHLPGFVPDPQPELAAASLFVLSSRYEGAGGLVLLEALAHRVPIVATDCSTGPAHVLRGGALGRLVHPEDVDELASAIGDHLAAPQSLTARASRGPQRAREFDSALTAQRLHTLLVHLIDDGTVVDVAATDVVRLPADGTGVVRLPAQGGVSIRP